MKTKTMTTVAIVAAAAAAAWVMGRKSGAANEAQAISMLTPAALAQWKLNGQQNTTQVIPIGLLVGTV